MTTHYEFVSSSTQNDLKVLCEKLVANNKGILSADEDTDIVMKERMELIELENIEENRRQFRQLMFSTNPEKLSEHLSAVILSPEAIEQTDNNGIPFIQKLQDGGILVGVSVDKGLIPMSGLEEETTTEGLDDLTKRCLEFRTAGCSFCKWRCVYKISRTTPTVNAMFENANLLGRFAAVCQNLSLLPIIEAEIPNDGDYKIERCQQATEQVLAYIVKSLNDHHIYLEGMILKISMVLPGKTCPISYTPEQIAGATITTLRRTVPAAIGAIAFLSGDLSEENASVYLNAMALAQEIKPWKLTFCFDRALTHSCLRAWGGKRFCTASGQLELLKRARANGLAVKGDYEAGSIPIYAADGQLFVAPYDLDKRSTTKSSANEVKKSNANEVKNNEEET